MDTTTSVLAAGLLVGIGTWAEGKSFNIRIVVGVAVLAIALSILGNVDGTLASRLALLVLVAALFRYGTAIFDKVKAIK